MTSVPKPRGGAHATSPAVSATSPMRVLCVEDNHILGELQRIFLEHAGYEVMVAEDRRAAWHWLKTRGADLLIADQEMLRETGRRLLTRACAAGMRVRVLVVFGSLESLALGEWAGMGMAGMLMKPYTQPALLAAVRKAMTRPPSCPPPARPRRFVPNATSVATSWAPLATRGHVAPAFSGGSTPDGC